MKRICAGFTLVELLMTVALVGLTASVMLPLASVIETRTKETELRRSLRTIRQALDNYKTAADSGLIEKPTGTPGYPDSLELLVSGVKQTSALGFRATPIYFLRSIPKDPFAPNKDDPPHKHWRIRSYGAKQGDFSGNKYVFDISSRSDRTALDGTRYGEW